MRIVKSLLLFFVIFCATIDYTTAESKVAVQQTVANKASKQTANKNPDDKYWAYSMDGVTSASKLAAQRSHTVAGKDERNFAIFTAITVILIIYFLTQFEFFR